MKYFLVYKPYMMLSQFTPETGGDLTLADLDFAFPGDVYAAGRLDKDSEGLLLLTNDKALIHKLLDPKFQHPRTYWVQVDNIPNEQAVQALTKGVLIKHKKQEYKTLPAQAKVIPEPQLPARNPPIRYRKDIPTAWIELTLKEGKNRQVRHMTAAIGHPTLRLVRAAIGDLKIGSMQPGDIREIQRKDIRF